MTKTVRNYRDVEIGNINYFKNRLYYEKEPLIIQTPVLECNSGIEKYFNRYELSLKLDITNVEERRFYNFIRLLEHSNKINANSLAEYKYQLIRLSDTIHILTLRVPFRYEKFEVEIESEKDYLPAVADVKKGEKIICSIHMNNLWTFSAKNKLMAGCVMDVKHIKIMR